LTKDGRRIKDGKISKEVFDLDKHKQKKKKREKDKNMMEKSYEEEYVEEFIDEEGNVVRVVKKVSFVVLILKRLKHTFGIFLIIKPFIYSCRD